MIPPITPTNPHPRPPTTVSESPETHDMHSAIIVATTVGYLVMGLLVYTLLNDCRVSGLPKWYKSTSRSKRDKLRLALWYIGVFLFWPVILPSWIFSRIGFKLCGFFGKKPVGERKGWAKIFGSRRKKQTDEESASKDAIALVDMPSRKNMPSIRRSEHNVANGRGDANGSREEHYWNEGQLGLAGPTVTGEEIEEEKIVWHKRHPVPPNLVPLASAVANAKRDIKVTDIVSPSTSSNSSVGEDDPAKSRSKLTPKNKFDKRAHGFRMGHRLEAIAESETETAVESGEAAEHQRIQPVSNERRLC
ncbi:hypothetical protein C8035_v002765 [Colletotrichum spinosum]|uniref:Uncharacterized protein n=1 Tax=Colletotrichum spinosum TaxID=1347390 RepID=A0A4R8Q4G3_9PEZI|nr:hypothetical protein C8035_v002765 [Colletotrichum spinosum]